MGKRLFCSCGAGSSLSGGSALWSCLADGNKLVGILWSGSQKKWKADYRGFPQNGLITLFAGSGFDVR